MKLVGSHVSSTSAYTLAVKKFTASGETIFTCAMGIRAEFGVDWMMIRGSRSGWNRSDVLFSLGGVIIAGTAPGVLFRIFR